MFCRKIKQRRHLKDLSMMKDQAMALSGEKASGSIEGTEEEPEYLQLMR